MEVKNLRVHRNLSFEDYQKLQGVSNSSLKPSFAPNAGMSFGTMVHNYLLEPDKLIEATPEIKLVAADLMKTLGPAYSVLEKEISVQCDFEYNGLVMPYRGRLDLCSITYGLVVDLKILSSDLIPTIKHFGYEKQLRGYAASIGAKTIIIIAYNRKLKKIQKSIVEPLHFEWEQEVMKNGVAKIKK